VEKTYSGVEVTKLGGFQDLICILNARNRGGTHIQKSNTKVKLPVLVVLRSAL